MLKIRACIQPLRGTLRLPVQVLLGLLVWSVLLSQTMGLLHSIVHAHANQAHVSVYAHTQEAQSADPHVHAHDLEHASFLDQVFSGHGSVNDCRLYDQCSHMDALPVLAELVQALVFLCFVFATAKGLAVARWYALFQARGPPLIR